MRIGKTILDTDNMTTDEMKMWIDALRQVRARRIEQENLTAAMNALITEAKEKGFVFLDKSCGFVREVDDFTVFDERA